MEGHTSQGNHYLFSIFDKFNLYYLSQKIIYNIYYNSYLHDLKLFDFHYLLVRLVQ